MGDSPKTTDTGPSRDGVMGDGTEEQNLGQPGDPSKRIKKDEVEDAFGRDKADKA